MKKIDYNKFMNTKVRKIIAILALIFMLAFLASFMTYLIDSTLLNGAIGLLTILTGCIAVGLYLSIVIDNRYGKEAQKKRMEEILKEQAEAEEKTASEGVAEDVPEEVKLDIVKEEDATDLAKE